MDLCRHQGTGEDDGRLLHRSQLLCPSLGILPGKPLLTRSGTERWKLTEAEVLAAYPRLAEAGLETDPEAIRSVECGEYGKKFALGFQSLLR